MDVQSARVVRVEAPVSETIQYEFDGRGAVGNIGDGYLTNLRLF